MEFLKEIALPQSFEHYKLVILIATISSMIFLPYISFVIGSALLSFRFRAKALKANEIQSLRVAGQIIEVPLKTKSVLMFLGIIPGASTVFSFAQLLQATPAISVTLIGFGFLIIAVGLWLLYSYKEDFRVQEIVASYHTLLEVQIEENETSNVLRQYKSETSQTHSRSGTYGIIFIFVGLFLYAASFSLAADSQSWQEIDSIFIVFISFSAWIKFAAILALSAGITGFGTIYFILSKQNNYSEKFAEELRTTAIRLSIISLIVLPVITLTSIATVNESALSGWTYAFAGIGLTSFFITAHLLYGYQRNLDMSLIAGGFYIFLIAAAVNIAGDLTAIGTTTLENAAMLSIRHEKNIEELKAGLGINLVTFTGEEIYNARCSSCHLFDQKKIGPPYIETIPKYEGNKKDLVAFILNPVRKNPDYPPMISQGLKLSEADSVASYIMRKIELSMQKTAR